jgi:hypothetical protein
MMHNIRVTAADHAWLSKVLDMLQSNDRAVRIQRHALEYFYRSWPLKDAERFPILCMALDALFGDANQATQAVIDGVRQTIGEHVEDARLRLLMQLRASVVHGGAPDVYRREPRAVARIVLHCCGRALRPGPAGDPG